MNKGLVIKTTGNRYTVKFNDEIIHCALRGKFKTKGFRTTNPIAVGDFVGFDFEEDKLQGVIKTIFDRKNFLTRKSTNLSKKSHIIAANIDFAIILITITKPTTYPMFIDRFLIACEANNIKAVLVFNKVDIYNEGDLQHLKNYKEIYSNIGYKCLDISVKKNKNIDKFKTLIKGKTIAISGNSGVGKSSLINLLEPGLKLKTMEISDYHEQGKHTTTFTEMHKIGNAYIIDTPGVRGFGLDGIDKEDLSSFFPEMNKLKNTCKFNNCTHTHEPDCAIKLAVENGIINKLRYKNYISIFNDEDDKHRMDKYV